MSFYKLVALVREEMRYYLTRWQFYISSAFLILAYFGFAAFTTLQQTVQESPLGEIESIFSLENAETFRQPVGYVDLSGIIQVVPPQQAEQLIAYPNQQAAAAALLKGDIERYYVVSANYIATGTIEQFALTPALLSTDDQIFTRLLNNNVLLLSGDPDLTIRLQDPLRIDYRGPELATFTLIHPTINLPQLGSALVIVGFILFLISMNLGFLQRPFEREIEAKITEVITTSVTGLEYILGKILGLGGIMLMQAAVWVGLNALVYSTRTIALDIELVAWPQLVLSMAFGLLGYLLISGLLLTVLSLLPNYINPSQVSFVNLVLLGLPVIGILFIIANPDSQAAAFLTFFPITAGILMPFRILIATVPVWQVAVSFGILVVAAYGVLQLSGYTFKMRAPHMRQ